MSTKKSNIGAIVKRQQSGAARGETAIRTDPVKVSFELTPPAYGDWTKWIAETAGELGHRVTGAQVGRELIAELVESPELTAKIRDRLKAK